MAIPIRAKPANQRRSQEKRDRILAAMDELLKRRPFAAIGVSDLARKAGVSPATIYQRFSNTDATASVLLELYFRKVEQWTRRPGRTIPMPNAPLLEALRMIAYDALDQLAATGHVIRPAYLYSRQHPERVGKDWMRLQELALAGFRTFLRNRSEEIFVKDPNEAAEVLCQLFNFQLLGPLLHTEMISCRSSSSRKRFADRLGDLAYRYLAFRP